jgi:hypothetical protein
VPCGLLRDGIEGLPAARISSSRARSCARRWNPVTDRTSYTPAARCRMTVALTALEENVGGKGRREAPAWCGSTRPEERRADALALGEGCPVPRLPQGVRPSRRGVASSGWRNGADRIKSSGSPGVTFCAPYGDPAAPRPSGVPSGKGFRKCIPDPRHGTGFA